MRRSWNVALVLGAAFMLAGCGADNPGEPRTPAEDLMAPNAATVDGKGHVYCVEEDDVAVTPCGTWIEVSNKPTRPALRAWWLRATQALRNAGTFTYKGGQWRFSSFSIRLPAPHGKFYLVGWRCARDAGRPRDAVISAMDARNPFKNNGIHSRAAAQRLGCDVAPYPGVYG